MKVIKRNGTEVDFDIEKIKSAIGKAIESVDDPTFNKKTANIFVSLCYVIG